MDDALTLLKMRLMLQALDQVPYSELHVTIMLEAKLACAQAASIGFPMLLFPCLFAERVEQALELEAERRSRYWQRAEWQGAVSAEPLANALEEGVQ